MERFWFFGGLFLIIGFSGCKKDDYNIYENITMKDVSYGSHFQQKMDVYLPAAAPHPTQKC